MARKRKADNAATESKAPRVGATDATTSPSAKLKPVGGPFADFKRPTEAECRAARDALAGLHGEPTAARNVAAAAAKVEDADGDAADAAAPLQRTVLDSLVRTILSQNTTDDTSARAFAGLKAGFPSWEAVLAAPEGAVEEAVRCGGLADIKVARIKVILETLLKERKELSLEYVRPLDDEAIKAELTRFKGVGPKTAACVLMFCLQRPEFPVDVHVWRISRSLGWVPAAASRDQCYEHLNLRVPDDIKYDLHVLLVGHGKRCTRCATNGRPRFAPDGPCPLFRAKGSAPGSAAKAPRQPPANAAKKGWTAGCDLQLEAKCEGGVAVKDEIKPEVERGPVKVEAGVEGARKVSSSGAEHYADLYQSAVKQEPGVEATHVPGAGGSGGATRALEATVKHGSVEKPRRTRVKLEHLG